MGVRSLLDLIKLEFKKHSLKRYVWAAVITNLAILGFVALLIITEETPTMRLEELTEGLSFSDLIPSMSVGFEMLDTLVKTAFVIFASVLLARLVIDEYKNKTISVMFMYPINRKKIMWAKLLIVMAFTIGAIFLSDVFQASALVLLNQFLHFVPDNITPQLAGQAIAKFLSSAVAFSGLGFIPLYFGMKKKSVPATILSAVVISLILNSSNGGLSLGAIIYIPIALTLIGIAIAYCSFRNIEKEDVI